jgi:hypothetical protein
MYVVLRLLRRRDFTPYLSQSAANSALLSSTRPNMPPHLHEYHPVSIPAGLHFYASPKTQKTLSYVSAPYLRAVFQIYASSEQL